MNDKHLNVSYMRIEATVLPVQAAALLTNLSRDEFHPVSPTPLVSKIAISYFPFNGETRFRASLVVSVGCLSKTSRSLLVFGGYDIK